jgi:benzoyl-CoA reductase/2-hydroxyglutaryl-CoA dehydratase subunit BcrC/BadD/HgdB
MAQIINKFQEIKERLEAENKNSIIDLQNITEAMERMNEEMEEVRRNFQVKDKNSQISAVNVILTA